MAFLYMRRGSPFWWVGYRDVQTGKVVRESTGFKIGVARDTLKAREVRAKHSLAEAQTASVRKSDRWDVWVPEFLNARYSTSQGTAQRMQTNWKYVSRYFEENGILSPAHVTRQHCIDYVLWRRKKNKSQGFSGVSQNTALLELRLIGILLGEALNRGMVSVNVCRDLKLRGMSPRPKPEISDAEIAKIRECISKANSDWFPYSTADWGHILRVTFEIALHQGCRLGETYIDVWRDVDLDHLTIRFHAKGDSYYETSLNPGLVPLFQELRAAGRAMTYNLPKFPRLVSLAWTRFLRRIGLPHLTFHSTRVTAISRLERAGAPEAVVMQLVNHASSTVHRIYRRVAARELVKFWPGPPGNPSPASPPPEPSQNPPSASSSHGLPSPDSRSQTGGQASSNAEQSSG